MKKYFLIPLIAVILAGCENTMHGFGQDLEQNGKEIQKSVQPKNKQTQS